MDNTKEVAELTHTPRCPTQKGGDPGGINRNYSCNCCLAEREEIAGLQATITQQSTEIDNLHDEADEYRATIAELEDVVEDKETPAAEVYELRKAVRIYKTIIAEHKATITELRKVTDCFADWVCLECDHMAQAPNKAPNSLRGYVPFAHPEFMNCNSCGKETRHLSHREWQLQLSEKNHLEFVKSFQEATGKVGVDQFVNTVSADARAALKEKTGG